MREKISKEAVQAVLGPHHDSLALCVVSAWASYLKHVKPTLPMPSRRGRANAVFDYWTNDARTRFGEVRGVKIFDVGGRFLLGFGTILVRFKKLTERLQTHNYQTALSLKFDSQKPWLPGVPDVAKITIGYVLNELETEIRAIHVVLLHNKRVQWNYEITAPAAIVSHPANETRESEGVVAGRTEENDITRARRKQGKGD